MFLTIVRHGQSTGNVSGDDIPDGELTSLGRQQARETAARLANAGITHVICSPLVRALETASIIAGAAGVRQIEVWPELQEHRWLGIHRGLGRAAILERFPNAVLPDSVEAEGWNHGGETYETALERGVSAMAALRARIGPKRARSYRYSWRVCQLPVARAAACATGTRGVVLHEQLWDQPGAFHRSRSGCSRFL